MLCTLYKPLSKSTNDIEPTLSDIITCYVCRTNSKYMLLQLSLILLDKHLQIYYKKYLLCCLPFIYLCYIKKKSKEMWYDCHRDNNPYMRPE